MEKLDNKIQMIQIQIQHAGIQRDTKDTDTDTACTDTEGYKG